MSALFSVSFLFFLPLSPLFFLPCPPSSFQCCCGDAHRNLKHTGCKWERTSPFSFLQSSSLPLAPAIGRVYWPSSNGVCIIPALILQIKVVKSGTEAERQCFLVS